MGFGTTKSSPPNISYETRFADIIEDILAANIKILNIHKFAS